MFVTAKIESFYCQLFKNTNIKFIKMKYHFEQVNLHRPVSFDNC